MSTLTQIIDTLIVWGVAVIAVIAMNQWGGAPGTIWSALVMDSLLVGVFFFVWGLSLLSRLTGEKFYDGAKVVVMPVSILISAVVTIILERAGVFAEQPYVQLVLFIVVTIIAENRLEKALKASGTEAGLDRLLKFVLLASFLTSFFLVSTLVLYGRLRAFGYIEGFPWLDEPALFLMNDSLEWILEYA